MLEDLFWPSIIFIAGAGDTKEFLVSVTPMASVVSVEAIHGAN